MHNVHTLLMQHHTASTKFGIEIETTLPMADTTRIGRYHGGAPVPWLPAGWKVERDGSIAAGRGRKGAEFVSPVISGADGVAQVMTAVEAIKSHGGRVNHSCGIHITFTFKGDTKDLTRLLHLFANHEKALFASTGTKSRERGRWSKSIRSYGSFQSANAAARRDRYHSLNLTHLANGHKRVECRLFSSSLNQTKIAGWIAMVLGLVEIATAPRARKAPWKYEPRAGAGKWANGSAAVGEMNRLFYRLGWTKGHTANVHGEDLLASSSPTIKGIKKEMVRLAKKYEAS